MPRRELVNFFGKKSESCGAGFFYIFAEVSFKYIAVVFLQKKNGCFALNKTNKSVFFPDLAIFGNYPPEIHTANSWREFIQPIHFGNYPPESLWRTTMEEITANSLAAWVHQSH